MDGRVLSPSSSFAEELISGLSREDEGIVLPDALHVYDVP